MLRIRRPDDGAIEAHVENQRRLPFTYEDAGASRDDRVPRGFNLDHTHRRLGDGEAAFHAACDAVRAWRMFPAWTRIHPLAPIEKDAVIAVVVRVLLWW